MEAPKPARDHRAAFLKTTLCKFNRRGICNKGPGCHFAHSKAELRPLPDLTKTRMCQKLMREGRCGDRRCTFAHQHAEIRHVPYENELGAREQQTRTSGPVAARTPTEGARGAAALEPQTFAFGAVGAGDAAEGVLGAASAQRGPASWSHPWTSATAGAPPQAAPAAPVPGGMREGPRRLPMVLALLVSAGPGPPPAVAAPPAAEAGQRRLPASLLPQPADLGFIISPVEVVAPPAAAAGHRGLPPPSPPLQPADFGAGSGTSPKTDGPTAGAGTGGTSWGEGSWGKGSQPLPARLSYESTEAEELLMEELIEGEDLASFACSNSGDAEAFGACTWAACSEVSPKSAAWDLGGAAPVAAWSQRSTWGATSAATPVGPPLLSKFPEEAEAAPPPQAGRCGRELSQYGVTLLRDDSGDVSPASLKVHHMFLEIIPDSHMAAAARRASSAPPALP